MFFNRRQLLLGGPLAAALAVSVSGTARSEQVQNEMATADAEASIDEAAETVMELNQAFRNLDSDSLLDVADKLSSGERKLPPTATAFGQKQVYDLAIRVAIQKRDKAVLDRLEQVAAKAADKDLAAKVKAARLLMSRSRAAAPAPAVSIDEISEDALRQYRSLRQDIAAAELSGDAGQLKVLTEVIPGVPELDEKVRQHLLGMIAEAQKNLPEEQDSSIAGLEKLMAGSRATPGVILIDLNGRQTPLKPNSWVRLAPGQQVVGGIDSTSSSGGTIYVHIPAQPRSGGGTRGAYLMVCPNLPLCLVFNGKRVQWATMAGAMFTRRSSRPIRLSTTKSRRWRKSRKRPGCWARPDGLPPSLPRMARPIFPIDSFGPATANGNDALNVIKQAAV